MREPLSQVQRRAYHARVGRRRKPEHLPRFVSDGVRFEVGGCVVAARHAGGERKVGVEVGCDGSVM